jgi:diadenosine tetraphosphate (Ap4A) HIT family hydrolase
MNCPFCQIDKSRIIFQNECFIAIADAHPVKPGHTLIITKRHAENIFELTKEEFCSLHIMLQQVKSYLEEEYSPDGYNVGANTGAAAGQSIRHFHLHVIPRYYNDPRTGILKKSINKLREYYTG